MRHPHVHDSLFYIARQKNVITLSGLLFKYNAIDPNAQTNGKIDVVNGQLKDKYVSGVWQNPYQEFTTLAITPSVIRYKKKSCSVVLPQNLWLSNVSGTVSSIQFDAGDGAGYRTLAFNTSVNLSYADTGWKHWTFKVNRTGGQSVLYTHTKVYFGNAGAGVSARTSGTPISARGTEIDLSQTITAAEAYNGKAGSARVIISYRSAADPVIRRPLIVAEGFDPGHITDPEEEEGMNDFDGFINRIIFSQSIALRNLISADPSQYDIIYVNWNNGTDFLQRNAFVLEAVIRWVNANKQPLAGVPQPNVVLGSSMGGVIARMALGRMDRGGGLNGAGGYNAHETRLYISLDAPHLGANVPLGAQAAARHARRMYVASGPLALTAQYVTTVANLLDPLQTLRLADQPASRQMLINRIDANYNISNTDHVNFQNELRTQWAFPANIRNVAISNGNECGIDQEYTAGSPLLYYNLDAQTRIAAELFDIFNGGVVSGLFGALTPAIPFQIPGRNRFHITLDVRTLANGGGNQVYYGNMSYTKKVLWLVQVTVTVANKTYNAPSGLLPLDTYPGGFYTLTFGGLPNSVVNNSFQTFNSNFNIRYRFAFVHTTSALCIGGGNQTLTNTQYMARYIGATPPAVPFNTPFQNFTTAFNANGAVWDFENATTRRLNNEPHEGIFLRSANWLAAELNRTGTNPGPASNCSALCVNMAITGPTSLCTNASYSVPVVAGANYTWSATPLGSVTFGGTGNSVTATKSPSFNGTATIQVNVTLAGCGDRPATINVLAGTPPATITSVTQPPPSYGTINVYFNLPGSASPITSHKWYIDNVMVYSSSGVPNSPTILNGGSCGMHGVRLDVISACGTSASNSFQYYKSCGSMFTAAPNPTNGQLTINVIEENTASELSQSKLAPGPSATSRKAYKIAITDMTGVRRKYFDYKSGITTTTINISDLRAGIYNVSVFDGKEWDSRKINKQ